jgi:L-fuculose-phosphate aldolase
MSRYDERSARDEIVRLGRVMYQKGYISASEGNLSIRLGPGRLLVTPSGLHKGFLEPGHMLVVDEDGRRTGATTVANRDLKPTGELPMHLEAYRLRPDVGAVIHAHPPLSIALSIAGLSVSDCLLPEAIVFLGLIPTTPYATPSSIECAEAISPLICNHDAVVLQRHGTVTVGRDLMEAFIRLEVVEQNARVGFMLAQLGIRKPLPAAEIRPLLQLRREMGLAHPGEADDFCEVCGVCHTGREHPPTLRLAQGKPSPGNGLSAAAPSLDDDAVRERVAALVRKTLGE